MQDLTIYYCINNWLTSRYDAWSLILKIETSKRETEDLKTKLKEMCQRSEKDHEVSMKERVDLVRRLADFRRSHKRDQRRIEDVLSEVK